MFIVDNVVIPSEIKSLKFSCQTVRCGSACCIVGDLGAPLSREEVESIRSRMPQINSRISQEARRHIRKYGFAKKSNADEWVLECIDGQGVCVFFFHDETGTGCVLESFQASGLERSLRPISCKLFPIRIRAWGQFILMDYERWDECVSSWNADTPLVYFCKDALVSRFGAEWYGKLLAALALSDNKD